MSQQTTLTIEGLTNAEVLDLESQLGPGSVQRKQAEKGRHGYGVLDPVTAMVMVSAITASTIALWVVKHRRRSSTELKITVNGPDNTSKTLEYRKDEYEEKSDEEIVKSITRELSSFLKGAA
jgi:hypothetical protein